MLESSTLWTAPSSVELLANKMALVDEEKLMGRNIAKSYSDNVPG